MEGSPNRGVSGAPLLQPRGPPSPPVQPCDRCAAAAELGGPDTAEDCTIATYALARGIAACAKPTANRAARFDARSGHAVGVQDKATCAIPCASGSSRGKVHFGMRFHPVRRLRRAANLTRRYYPACAAEGRGAGARCPPQPAPPKGGGMRFVPQPAGGIQRSNASGAIRGRPPSFAIVLFDAAPRWSVEAALRPIAEAVVSCRRRPGSMSAAWTLHRFQAHNAAALNTMPNLLALLA